MIKKAKIVASISLIVILLLPTTIKLFDGLFHHHYHNHHCDAKSEMHFYEYHERCPIPGFELSFFSITKQVLPVYKFYFNIEITDRYNFVNHFNYSKYSFLLRAPPFQVAH